MWAGYWWDWRQPISAWQLTALLQVPAAVGPLLLGMAARSAHRPVTAFSLVCGVVGSVASLLCFSQVYLGFA